MYPPFENSTTRIAILFSKRRKINSNEMQIFCFWTKGTVFPHIRPTGIIFSYGLQLRVLLEITKFHLHKSVPGAGIIRIAGIIPGRALF